MEPQSPQRPWGAQEKLQGQGEHVAGLQRTRPPPSLAFPPVLPPPGSRRPSTTHSQVEQQGSKPPPHPPAKAAVTTPKAGGGRVLEVAEGTNNKLQRHPKRRRSSSANSSQPLQSGPKATITNLGTRYLGCQCATEQTPPCRGNQAKRGANTALAAWVWSRGAGGGWPQAPRKGLAAIAGVTARSSPASYIPHLHCSIPQ